MFSFKAKKNSGIDDFIEESDRINTEYQDSVQHIPKPKVLENRIDDVLSVLDIPPSFTIDEVVLMPSDYDNIKFDVEVPSGYTRAQVNSFLQQSRSSAEYYVDLLQQRNRHIALLATTVDRLQVDLANAKAELQISMAQNQGCGHEYEIMSLQSTISSLREEIQRLQEVVKNHYTPTDPAVLSALSQSSNTIAADWVDDRVNAEYSDSFFAQDESAEDLGQMSMFFGTNTPDTSSKDDDLDSLLNM